MSGRRRIFCLDNPTQTNIIRQAMPTCLPACRSSLMTSLRPESLFLLWRVPCWDWWDMGLFPSCLIDVLHSLRRYSFYSHCGHIYLKRQQTCLRISCCYSRYGFFFAVRRRYVCIQSGLAAGLAYLVRYNAIFVLVGIPLALLFLSPAEDSIRQRICKIVVFATAALAVTAPWLLVNWQYHGNPFASDLHGQVAAHFYHPEGDGSSSSIQHM